MKRQKRITKKSLIELRQRLDAVIESGTDRDQSDLRQGLAEVLRQIDPDMQTPCPEGDDLRQALQAIEEVWFKGSVPPEQLPGKPDQRAALSRLLSDMLAVQKLGLSISEGDLSQQLDAKGVMAGSFKTLQANLRHLTWQTEAISRGDFSQRVEFMGDFSKAFNEMVSNLFEARQALLHIQDELEVKVQQRTAELSMAYETLQAGTEERRKLEDRLRQSQKMEAIGTLAGGIAHDFNNVLAGVIGFTEMALEDTTPGHPLRRQLELVLKAGQRGRDLVRQIMTFSRRTEREKKPVAASHIVDEALKLLRPALPSTINIRKNFRTEEDTVLGDPSQLHQIFMNLCTNAAHAMRDKGGALEVNLCDADFSEEEVVRFPGIKAGPYIDLSVSDTGCGMTSDVAEKIFDPFFTTKGPGEGTGLGLSVADGIAKSHGGYITVYSEPSRGSTFHVYLPKTGIAADAQAKSTRPVPGGQERILFVDDEAMLAEMNSLRLQKLGYHVVTRTSSIEALDTFKAEPTAFDLVITDYTMPHMTGIDLAQAILAIRPEIPVILCSGLNETPTPEKVKDAGIRAFTPKTSDRRDLAELIRQVLDEGNEDSKAGSRTKGT